jgi:hypothetical protein
MRHSTKLIASIRRSFERVQKWMTVRGHDDISAARQRLLEKLWAKAIAPIERKHEREIAKALAD